MDPRLRGDESFAATPLGSLDLGFLELDVLARARIIFLEAQLLGLRARVLLRHVEESRVRGADELDLDGCRLGHRVVLSLLEKRKAAAAARSAGSLICGRRFVKFSAGAATQLSARSNFILSL